jgi:hypothetical protein
LELDESVTRFQTSKHRHEALARRQVYRAHRQQPLKAPSFIQVVVMLWYPDAKALYIMLKERGTYLSATSWIAIISDVIFTIVGLVCMFIGAPMAMRSIYSQLPMRLHRSVGRISAWLIALGSEAIGLALVGLGVASLLGLIDQRMSERAFAVFSTSGIVLYFMVAILLAVLGALTFFVGRIVSYHRNR